MLVKQKIIKSNDLLKDVEKWRKENNIAGKCEPFAVNDKILWENISFVTNDEGESEFDEDDFEPEFIEE